MEANVSKYTNAIGSGKQAITQRQKRKGGRGMREGWEYKKLGEVAIYPNKRMSLTNISGQQYVGVETLVKDRGGVAFSEELPNVDTAIEFLENDILIGNIRPYLKKIWKADRHGASSGDVVNIRIAENFKGRLDSSFLYKVLSSDSFFEYDNSNTHGAKMPRGDRKAIAEFKIPIPPLSTQQSIVSELDKINELIRLKKEQLKDYDNLAQSIFYEMFGDPVANDKKWDVESLGKVCDVRDGTHDSPQYLQESPYILITSKNLVNGKIDYSNVNYISEEDYIAINKRSQVDDGDIIMAMIGTIGNPIIVKLEECKFCIKNVALIKFFNESLVSNKYIHSLLNNDSYLSFIKSQNKGGTQKFVALGTIRKLPIPIPPLSFQQQFAQRIELIEQQKEEIKSTIADLETLLASRMQYWFG